MMTAARTIGVIITILFARATAYGQESDTQEERFPALTGPYPVGTIDYFWIDADRPETYTQDPDDKRHLFVKVWYPAGPVGDAPRAPYLPPLEEFEDPSIFEPYVSMKSRSYAGVAVAEGRFPVLLYSHGGLWTRFSACFQTEAFTSQGYVVVAIDHTGFNKSTKFPDGYEFVNDALPFPEETDELRAGALKSWEYLGHIAKIWQADAKFVLDRLEAMQADDGVLLGGHLDLDRIGMFGWSFGGALSIQMTKDDPRVKAAVDQDGQLFGDVRDTGTSRPIMLMRAPGDSVNPDNDPIIDELIEMVNGWNETTLKKSTHDWFDLEIARVQHAHFSDLSLFFPMPPDQTAPARAHEIIHDFTLAFFDRYLRGKASLLLHGETDAYPEVVLRRNQITGE